MKKALICLMCLVMMCGVICSAAADGNTYAGEILFNGIPWGANVTEAANILSQKNIGFVSGLQSMEGETALNANAVSDPLLLYNWEVIPDFAVSASVVERAAIRNVAAADYTTVAGHEVASAVMLFAYVPENGELRYDDAHTAFYCASYLFSTTSSFMKTAPDVQDDLIGKLSGLYGEPYYAGRDLTFIFGDLYMSDAGKKALFGSADYAGELDTYYGLVQYAAKANDASMLPASHVWRSDESNAYIILTSIEYNGKPSYLGLTYLCADGFDWLAAADALTEPVPAAEPMPNTSVDGL